MIRWRHSLNDNDDFTEKERKKYPKNQSNLVKIHTCEDSSGTYRRWENEVDGLKNLWGRQKDYIL